MHIKQAQAPIGRSRWDHSFKQNYPQVLAAEAKGRNNLIFPTSTPPPRTVLGFQRTLELWPRLFPRPRPLACEREVEPSCAALCSLHPAAGAPPPPALGPQAVSQPWKTSRGLRARVKGPPPLPGSVEAARQGSCRSTLAKTSGFQRCPAGKRPDSAPKDPAQLGSMH